jgi:hypothetical protein
MSLGCSGGGGSDGRAHIIAGLGTCTAVRINRVFVWFIAKQMYTNRKGKMDKGGQSVKSGPITALKLRARSSISEHVASLLMVLARLETIQMFPGM